MASTVGQPAAAPSRLEPVIQRRLPWGNPWRRPWAMEGFTWLYILWSILPIAIAVLFSFNKGASQATWQGFSTKWYVGHQVTSVLHNPTPPSRRDPDARARGPDHGDLRPDRSWLRDRHRPLAHPDRRTD